MMRALARRGDARGAAFMLDEDARATIIGEITTFLVDTHAVV